MSVGVLADETQRKDALVSILSAAPVLTPFSNYHSESRSESLCAFCIGDIGEKRQELYASGIALDFGVTNVTQGVVSGGQDEQTANTTVFDQQVSLDTGRLGWWSGGLVVLHGRAKAGGNVLSDAGTLSPTNHVALTPDATKDDQWFLEEYYLFQALSEKWSVIAGRVLFAGIGDLNRFAGNEKTQFVNTSLRNSPLLGIISVAQSLHGAALNYTPNSNIILSPFVLSNNDEDATWGSPGGIFSEYSAGVQLQYSWNVAGLEGYVSPLIGYTSLNAADFGNGRLVSDALEGLPVPEKKDNWVVGFSFDHYIYKPEKSNAAVSGSAQFDKEPEGIGIFARFHYAPEDRNAFNVFASAGVGARGVIPGRENDRYGLGFYKLFESGDFNDEPVIGDLLEDEWGMEAFYNFAITPWLQVSPSIQYVNSGVKSVGDSTILSLRVQADF